MKQDISRILVVFKTHLDVGFTYDARTIVREYMDHYIPAALRLAKATRNSNQRFVWTTGSWLAYRFLEEAGSAERRLMEAAIEAGDFHWHALPFTTHSELMDASLFRLGLRFSQILDQRFGRKTVAAKMTDVPGHTKAIVPLLAERGVRLLHIGVNPASQTPAVPPVFVWKVEGAEVVVAYENVYGATTRLPGGMAASVNLTNDNLGPQNPAEIQNIYSALETQFPGACISAGSLDEVAEWTWQRRDSLPVVTDEIGDTWIHGVGTDPAKVAQFRTLCRLRSKWIGSGDLQEGGSEDLASAENLLLVAEHTWGMDIKTHLHDWTAYSRNSLRRARSQENFQTVEASWREQREYISAAVKALAPVRQQEAKRHVEALKPVPPPARKNARLLPPGERVQIGNWVLSLDPLDGSINYLRQTGDRQLIADARHRLACFSYQTFSASDYDRFYRQYNTLDVEWAQRDFMKWGLPATALAGLHAPQLQRVTFEKETLHAELRFGSQARRFGAPAKSFLTISPIEQGLSIQLQWFDKPANRMPEAFWLKFAPRLQTGVALTLEKFGMAIDPKRVVRRGNRHLHAVTGAVKWGGLSIVFLDAALVAPGKPQLLDFNQKQPSPRKGVSFNLYNNVWGTNFPMWYSEDALFRFVLSNIK